MIVDCLSDAFVDLQIWGCPRDQKLLFLKCLAVDCNDPVGTLWNLPLWLSYWWLRHSLRLLSDGDLG